eukprot:4029699-Pyramimonas_sp.AAC.1
MVGNMIYYPIEYAWTHARPTSCDPFHRRARDAYALSFPDQTLTDTINIVLHKQYGGLILGQQLTDFSYQLQHDLDHFQRAKCSLPAVIDLKRSFLVRRAPKRVTELDRYGRTLI